MCSSLGEGTFVICGHTRVCALSGSSVYALCVNNGDPTVTPNTPRGRVHLKTKPNQQTKYPHGTTAVGAGSRSLSEVTLGTARYSLVLQQSGAGLDPVRFTNRKAGMFSR